MIDQHIDRMHTLCESGQVEDAYSVYNEIRDWVIKKENLQILSLHYISDYFEDF